MAFGTYLDRFSGYLKLRGLSNGTISKYKRALLLFFRFLETKEKILRLQDVQRDHLGRYAAEVMLRKRQRDGLPVSQSTKGLLLWPLKSFFSFMVRIGVVLYNPADALDPPHRGPQKVRDVLKEGEILKIIKAAPPGPSPISLRDRALLETFYSTGMRNSEARYLKPQDIDFDRREIKIKYAKGYFGTKQRVVPIGKTACKYLEKYLHEARPSLAKEKDSGYCFLSVYGNILQPYYPALMVNYYAKKAKMQKTVTAHMFRHACATHLLQHGADIRVIQELLGHKTLDATRLYAKVDITYLRRIHEKTHPRK